jgi:acyl carrier protein
LSREALVPAMKLGDIAEYDSMNNVTLMLLIEEAFGVTLADAETNAGTTVAEIVETLRQKGASVA